MIPKNLLGTWKLVSAEYRRASGEVLEIYGANPKGMLMYDAQGNMTIHIMRVDRPLFAKPDRLGGTPEQAKAAFEGYLAYFGTYSVDEQKGAVTHHIEGSLLPNWVGVDQMRFFKLEGDRLILSTPALTIGDEPAQGYIVWQKIDNG